MRETQIAIALFCATLATTAAASTTFPFEDTSDRLPPEANSEDTDTFDIDLADIDHDGDLDVFASQGTASTDERPNRILVNDGSGQFTEESQARLDGKDGSSIDVAFEDVDQDGDLDAAVSNVGSDQLLLNDGNGFFTDVSDTHLPPPRTNPLLDVTFEIQFADVEPDGDPDMFVAHEVPFPPFEGSPNEVWINDGTGHFTDETAQRFPATQDQTGGFAWGDFDGDGDNDVVASNMGQNRIYMNDGHGFFTEETAQRLPTLEDSSRHVETGDLDRDGDLDLFFTNSRDQQNRLYFNDGHGFFTDVTDSHLPRLEDTSIDVDLRDVDQDGDLDAYVANSGEQEELPQPPPHTFVGQQNRYYENDGTGLFTDVTHHFFPKVVDASFDSDWGDVDGDGDIDVIVGNVENLGQERLYLRR